MGGQPHGGRRAAPPRARDGHARKRRRVLGAGLVLAAGAFAAGLLTGASHVPAPQRNADRFAAAWERGDFAAMYSELSDVERHRVRRGAFTAAYQRALHTATARRVTTGPARHDRDAYRIPVRIDTRVFGVIRGEVRVPVGEGGVDWSRDLVFPGLRRGERLSRTTHLPERATLLARDKTPLAQGPGRTSPLGPVAGAITGTLGPIPADRRAALAELGVPSSALVGASGLERIFDERLLGRPGGDLRAGGRLIASAEPQRAEPVRTTISKRVQAAVVDALGPRLGGIVAMDPRTGAVLGAAGIGLSGLQPPGSTFKIITLAGALEARLASPGTMYPVQTEATIEGVELENANGEACGGNLVASFAESCNSVFAPLGARLGARRLVAAAERFGFNHDPGLPGAAMSTIPPASEIGDDLAVGSSAIGQGRVQATALQMAVVAAAIGRRGQRPEPTLDFDAARTSAPTYRATSARVARTVERMMLAVVRDGTGTSAAISGVKVAGKTGTAELRTTRRCEPDPADPEACPEPAVDDPSDTDAWFAAYAPAGDGRPRVAVGVMLVGAGAGGDTAAPAAREVLAAGLRTTSRP